MIDYGQIKALTGLEKQEIDNLLKTLVVLAAQDYKDCNGKTAIPGLIIFDNGKIKLDEFAKKQFDLAIKGNDPMMIQATETYKCDLKDSLREVLNFDDYN